MDDLPTEVVSVPEEIREYVTEVPEIPTQEQLLAGAKSCLTCGATEAVVNGKCAECPDCAVDCGNIEPPYCHCLGWQHADRFDRKPVSPDQHLCQSCFDEEEAEHLEAKLEEAQAIVPQGE